MFTISFFFCYYILSISVSSVKPTALKVYPHLLMDLFFKFELRSCEEDRKSILTFSSKHMHPPGPYFPARSEEAAHCGRFGTLGTNTHSKMARSAQKAWVCTSCKTSYIVPDRAHVPHPCCEHY